MRFKDEEEKRAPEARFGAFDHDERESSTSRSPKPRGASSTMR